jgi:hypothetical protein
MDIAAQKIYTTSAEKDALQAQLNQVKTEFEKMKSDNTDLQTQLSAKDEEIKSKVAEIQRLISMGGPAQIAKAKAELARLKEMNNVYQTQIDSLNKANTALIAQNKDLNTNLTDEQSKNKNLSSENTKLSDKVAAGSILKAINIVTDGIRIKSSGKEVITNKAKQIQKVRTKFVLSENHVIEKGPVDIYLRVLGPDGSVMSSDQATFTFNGTPLVYTTKQTIDYNNEDMPVEAAWAKGGDFTKGKYEIEIYQSGNLIGKSTIDLK